MASATLAPSFSHFSSPHREVSFSSTRYRIKATKQLKQRHLYVHRLRLSCFQAAPRCSMDEPGPSFEPAGGLEQGEEGNSAPGYFGEPRNGVGRCVSRGIMSLLFCLAVGFRPVCALPAGAVAAPASEVKLEREEEGREYSGFTRCLLDEVLGLVTHMEEVKKGHGGMERVELGLRAVKAKKEGLKRKIMDELGREEKELNREKASLVERAEDIEYKFIMMRNENGNVGKKGRKSRTEKVEETMSGLEEYERIWGRIGEIEDEISRINSGTSIGVRELCFVERECEELVKKFRQEMRQKKSFSTGSVTKLSRADIQKELESAQRRFLEETILPNVVEADGAGPVLNQDYLDFATRIKQSLEDSRKLQKDVESHIRMQMKRFGDEKKVTVHTPEHEVIKGYPELEVKWMFGDKEVPVPSASRSHLYKGWKKWREDAKADLKRRLLEDADFGKQYVAEKQERLLLDRDRVISQTWYNEEKNRWEIAPMAASYAVSRKLVDHARIRHDWGAMYLKLKGEEKDYFLDVEEFNMIYDDFGGFDGLRMKMLANGIPTVIQFMSIPFLELKLRQYFLWTWMLAEQCSSALWNNEDVAYWREFAWKKLTIVNEDIMVLIVLPLVDFIVRDSVKEKLAIAWPEGIGYFVGSTYLKWRSDLEMKFRSRKRDDMGWFRQLVWFLWFLTRTVIYGYILFHVFRFLKRKVPRALGFGPLLRDPSIIRKFRRLKAYIRYKRRKYRQRKKAGIDPITTSFDHMKRVKNPPIPLKEFASIESMREEINEVVAFLQNPTAFQEMGARAPRGVLIVGGKGSGKTSLALAIAAEAKVPVVNVEAEQLEAGLWVGQGASNVRELFQTARDLAPVIIFVEDFDLFAGVRGKCIQTKLQDHEAFINQLLVELDGFGKQEGVVLMATTTSIKRIDEALRRPGRMDRVFYLHNPTDEEREKILRSSAKRTMDENLIELVDWKKVAEKTSLLRPSELQYVPVALEGSAFRRKFLDADELMGYCSLFATYSNAIPKWVRRTKLSKWISRMLVDHLGLSLTKVDLQNVVDLMEPYGKLSNGMELMTPPVDWNMETKFPHAVWAAGRCLIALLLPNYAVVDALWLEPSSWQGIGCTKMSNAQKEDIMNKNLVSRSSLEKKLVFCFGSYVASKLLLPVGQENYLSASELKQAQEIATRMVIQYGWGPEDSPAVYHTNSAMKSLRMGSNKKLEIAARVERIYDLAYLKAREMLQKNIRVLEKIVEELLEFEILTGKDLDRILQENGGMQEKEPFILSTANYREPVSSTFLDVGNGSGPALSSASPF